MIKNIMSRKVVSVKPSQLLRDVISLMDKHGYKEIPVVEDKKVKGVVSYFTVLNLIRFRGDSKVSNFMSVSPIVKEDDSQNNILELVINSGVTGFPVISKNKKIVGFVSDFDLLKFYKKEGLFKKLRVNDSHVKSIKPVLKDSKIGEVKNIMNFNKRDRLPVINKKGEFIGTILLIDLLRTFYKSSPEKIGRGEFKGGISKLMRISIEGLVRTGVFAKLNDSLNKAVGLMLENNLKGLIILNDNNEPVGVLDRCSVLKTVHSIISKSRIALNVSGEIPENIVFELKRVIFEQLKLLPRYKKSIREIKVFAKRIHDSNSKGSVEMNFRIIRDHKNINIKKEGFDILIVLMDCIDTANYLLKQETRQKYKDK